MERGRVLENGVGKFSIVFQHIPIKIYFYYGAGVAKLL
jgi:hypothetical protein